MHWRLIIKIVGWLTFFLGLAMLVPMVFGIYYGDASVRPLAGAMGLTVAAGLLLVLLSRSARADVMSTKDGMAIVAFGWTAIGFFGALPFYFSIEFGPFVNAFFESVSGFTTTGSSILTDIESVPKGLLLWRSLIQWLGGMGIIVLSIAVLPFLGVGGVQLFKAEVPSPVLDKLKPRIRDTATTLWQVYALITVAEIILLMFGGMTFYEALNHAFTTMPTGGFSTKNASVAGFDSVYIDGVIIFFMVAAGINFSLHYQLLRGKPLAFWRDTECRFFLGLLLVLTLIVSLDIYRSVYETIGDALRFGSFQVVSIVTTTGYATADYELWPALSQLILLGCMFIGASAGSTGGGVKCLRVIICLKFCYRELFSLIHPRAVTHIKIAGKQIPDDLIRSVMGFLALYLVFFALSSVALAGMGVDFVTAFTATASAIGNIGPGFGMVGPAENFALIPDAGKWLLSFCMLLGRLEIFTIIVLFVPEFWRR